MILLLIQLPDDRTPTAVFINIIMILLITLLIWKAHKYPFILSKKSLNLCYLLTMLFCLFGFWAGDWYHYYHGLEYMRTQQQYLNFITLNMDTLELPYYYIAELVNYNYILWRIIVWGLTLFFIYRTMLHLELNKNTFILFFIVIALLNISYARVSLAMAIAFYGYAFTVKPYHFHNIPSIFSYIFGISLIVISLFFHKSAFFLIFIFSLSLVKLNKYTLISIIILFPIVTIFINTTGLNYLISFYGAEEGFINIERVQFYITSYEKKHVSLAQSVSTLSRYATFYTSFVLLCKIILNRFYRNMPYYLQTYINVTVWIILISTLFAFNDVTNVIFYRLLYFSSIPCAIVLSYLMLCRENYKFCNLIFYIGIFYTIYTVFHSFIGSFNYIGEY